MLVCKASGGRYKIMASPERDCSWVDVRKDQENYLQTPEIVDENTAFSSGEIEIMRNHSIISSKLCSPSRKTSKQKPPFKVHGSPLTYTKLATSTKGSQEKRKTLQVLQPSADGKGLLVGSSGTFRKEIQKQKKDPRKGKSKAVRAQKTLKECTESTTGTSSDSDSSTQSTEQANSTENESNEAFALMVQDPPPERYWQMIAEERRIALREALEENERLCKELKEQKELCRKLEEVAGQAEYFASLYHMVLEGEAPDLEDSETESSKNGIPRQLHDNGDPSTS